MCLLQDTSPEVLNLVAIQNKLKDYGMAELVIKQVYRNQTCTCLTYILALPETLKRVCASVYILWTSLVVVVVVVVMHNT